MTYDFRKMTKRDIFKARLANNVIYMDVSDIERHEIYEM